MDIVDFLCLFIFIYFGIAFIHELFFKKDDE